MQRSSSEMTSQLNLFELVSFSTNSSNAHLPHDHQMWTWGRHTSVYHELTKEQVSSLENAIRFTFHGYYEAAQTTYSIGPLQHCQHPLVVIEQAMLYGTMGLEHKRLETLTAIAPPSERQIPLTGADIWDLWSLIRLLADCDGNGHLQPAVDNLLHLAPRLSRKSVKDYSDIEVSRADRKSRSEYHVYSAVFRHWLIISLS